MGPAAPGSWMLHLLTKYYKTWVYNKTTTFFQKINKKFSENSVEILYT